MFKKKYHIAKLIIHIDLSIYTKCVSMHHFSSFLQFSSRIVKQPDVARKVQSGPSCYANLITFNRSWPVTSLPFSSAGTQTHAVKTQSRARYFCALDSGDTQEQTAGNRPPVKKRRALFPSLEKRGQQTDRDIGALGSDVTATSFTYSVRYWASYPFYTILVRLPLVKSDYVKLKSLLAVSLWFLWMNRSGCGI